MVLARVEGIRAQSELLLDSSNTSEGSPFVGKHQTYAWGTGNPGCHSGKVPDRQLHSSSNLNVMRFLCSVTLSPSHAREADTLA